MDARERSLIKFSPQAWGCTVIKFRGGIPTAFSPQAWGCTVASSECDHRVSRFPHRRGGVPATVSSMQQRKAFSPQAWGCTVLRLGRYRRTGRFPHRRGGVPGPQYGEVKEHIVFPTGVGVYRVTCAWAMLCWSFPHRRGGVPTMNFAGGVRIQLFSPQAWGCTESRRSHGGDSQVFPTGVGVYRSHVLAAITETRFPHRRGGVPLARPGCHHGNPFSPQAWGCTDSPSETLVRHDGFPTGVGCTASIAYNEVVDSVFPTGVGCTVDVTIHSNGDIVSPQAWGCTGECLAPACSKRVFPTGVGVYRLERPASARPTRFPHRRGGCTGADRPRALCPVRFPHRRGGVPFNDVIEVADG